MNPLGLILIGLGLVLIIIGFKGSQHNIITALQGVKGGGSVQAQIGTATPPNSSTPATPAKGVQIT